METELASATTLKASSRLSRKNFIIGYFGLIIIGPLVLTALIIIFLESLANASQSDLSFFDYTFVPFMLFIVVALVLLFCFSIWLHVLRLHDVDKTGWFALIAFIPLANLILLIYLLVTEGDSASNKYGLPNGERSLWGVLFKKSEN